MLKNYITVAFRNILRHKGFSLINILSLAIGMAATILITLFVYDELSYDRYHEKADRIVRVSRAWLNQDGEISLHLGHVAPPFAPLLENDYEGTILNAVRFLNDDPLLTYEDTQIEEERVFFTEEDVFEVFSWKLLKGDPATALSEPNSIVLTEETARKYFGDDDPLGKQINYSNLVEMKVTGVAEEVPLNSHFKWDALVSFITFENFVGKEQLMRNFGSNNYATYLLLPEGYDYKELQADMGAFLNRHLNETDDGRMPEEYNRLTLLPITDIHLHSNLDSEVEANGDITYVYIYSIIATFILVIACINFMNLSTARSAKRAKEVGLRKVIGAYRTLLIRQFMVESMLFALFGVVFAAGIVLLVLPAFNNFIGKELALDLTQNTFTWILLAGITLVSGIVAGSYPALVLSSFQPATILKGKGKASGRTVNLRSVLVVVQFTISIALIIGVGVVQNQLQYMIGKDLGFDRNNLIVLPSNDEIYMKFESVQQELEEHPNIERVSLSSRIPSGRLLDSQGTIAEVDGQMQRINFRVADVHVDHGYLQNFGVELAEGRFFDPERASDSTEAFILNEAAVEAIGWDSPAEAIEKRFEYGNRKGQIVGVVKDFHFESLHQKIAPIVFLVTTGRARSVAIRYDESARDEVMAYLTDRWAFLRPGFPFTYYFVNERFEAQYGNEERLVTVVQTFSILAIIIAAMGLFGLSAFVAEQRIKEIGIRKVMGASVSQILYLLSRGTTVLVVLSFVVAAPIAYLVMNDWLENFAYADGIPFLPFLAALAFGLLVAWVTISYQTFRASRSNPVDSLRYE